MRRHQRHLVNADEKEEWDAVIQTNLSGAFYTTQACDQFDAQTALGADHHISSVFGQNRPGGPGKLCGFQSRADRLHHGDGAWKCFTQHHRQCGGARIYFDTAMTEALSADLKSRS